MENVLVIGSAPGSIGEYAVKSIRNRTSGTGVFRPEAAYRVVTAGVGEEDYFVDITDEEAVVNLMGIDVWDHVVCTAGINLDGNQPDFLRRQLEVNVVGHAIVFNEWVNSIAGTREDRRHHFVSISSNSAHRPRSRSGGYCASKAALSMYMRSLARAWNNSGVIISVLEPGWVTGTPMSQQVASRLFLPDQQGIDPGILADHIADILRYDKSWNGTALRIDNGEI